MEEKKEREGEAESLSPETPQTGRLRGRSRKRTDAPEGKKKAGRIALAAVIGTAVLAAAGAGYYFLETGKYKTAFFPNTTINGINASGKTVEEVKSLIRAFRLYADGPGPGRGQRDHWNRGDRPSFRI